MGVNESNAVSEQDHSIPNRPLVQGLRAKLLKLKASNFHCHACDTTIAIFTQIINKATGEKRRNIAYRVTN